MKTEYLSVYIHSSMHSFLQSSLIYLINNKEVIQRVKQDPPPPQCKYFQVIYWPLMYGSSLLKQTLLFFLLYTKQRITRFMSNKNDMKLLHK